MYEGDLSVGRIAQSAFRAFCSACTGLNEDVGIAYDPGLWEELALSVFAVEDSDVTVAELGRRVYVLFCALAGLPADEGAVPGRAFQVAWQAVACHLWAILQGDDEDLQALEESWIAWARTRKPDPE